MRFVFLTFLWILLGLINSLSSKAQFFSFSPVMDVPVFKDGDTQAMPWTGAYNSGQFWPCDMNNDGEDDLLLYDKTSGRTLVFLATPDGIGSYIWRYSPDYESLLPDIDSWISTADFNCDGRKDLFTQTSAGIKVFRNVVNGPTQSGFVLEVDGLTSIGFSGIINVQVNPYGAPAFIDVDNDGDLDVLNFDFTGNTVEYHKNLILENQSQCAGFQLKKDSCVFGLFATKPACGQIKTNTTCYGQRPGRGEPLPSQSRIMHIGSQLSALDLDGDGDKDLLVGDLGCHLLNRLINGGTTNSALITTADTLFPSASQYINLSVFPSAYHLDLNFDQKQDLVVTPTTFSNEGDNNVVNTRSATYYYVNNSATQTPDFQLAEKDFMQNQMIDLGEESTPVFADIDADGDQDLIVGHRGLKIGQMLVASLFLYRNTGTTLLPEFTLENTNYLGLGAVSRKRLKPIVADFNHDGAMDFGWMSSPGDPTDINTSLTILLNQNAAGQPWNLKPLNQSVQLNFAFGPYDSPVFMDVNGDGATDMLVGKYAGRVQYWKQISAWPNLQYQLVESNYGNIKRYQYSNNPNLCLADANNDGKPDLVTGDLTGQVKIYRSFKDQPVSNFPADSMWYYNASEGQLTSRYWGKFTSPALADLNNDGYPEMVIGTTGGGIALFVNRLGPNHLLHPNEVADVFNPSPWKIWPNPLSPQGMVKWSGPAAERLKLLNAQGQLLNIWEELDPSTKQPLSLPPLSKGLYFLQFTNQKQTSAVRLEVQ